MSTEQMTPAQMERAIAELRGWKAVQWKDVPDKYNWWPSLPERWTIQRPDGYALNSTATQPHFAWHVLDRELPHPLRDANAALELLEEMPAPTVAFYTKSEWFCDVDEWKSDAAIVSSKTFCAAVCLAWYEHRTGKRIELIEELKA